MKRLIDPEIVEKLQKLSIEIKDVQDEYTAEVKDYNKEQEKLQTLKGQGDELSKQLALIQDEFLLTQKALEPKLKAIQEKEAWLKAKHSEMEALRETMDKMRQDIEKMIQ